MTEHENAKSAVNGKSPPKMISSLALNPEVILTEVDEPIPRKEDNNGASIAIVDQ